MSMINEKDFPSLPSVARPTKDDSTDHAYTKDGAGTSHMETSRSTGTKRALAMTPGKEPAAKQQAVREPSLADIMAAIKRVDDKVEWFGEQLKGNSTLLASIADRVDSNSVTITENKSRLEALEKECTVITDLKSENAALKVMVLEVERYKRRWNLRLSGLKEKDDENIRKKVEGLLVKICPSWERVIEDVVDSVHRIGKKEDGRARQVIMQFVRRRHRDAVWKATKNSEVCRELGIRFVEDFTQEDRKAREKLWPKIKQARDAGKTAFYKGHVAIIDGFTVKA